MTTNARQIELTKIHIRKTKPRVIQDVHPDSAWKWSLKNLHETYQCRMCSRKLLMMGRKDARNM